LRRHELRAEEAERLRALLDLREILPEGGVAAEVVARGALPWYRTFVVDRGSATGVALNAPVVCPEGLVGRTIVVAAGASKVQSLLDQHAGAAVMVERSRVTGVVSGQVGATDQLPWLALKYVPARSDVVTGDRVVTSGLDRIYPKGLLVGHVARVGPGSGLFQDILVAPAAPFERLEAVVLLPPTPPEPLALEEPR
jgi:rod shape-determining protein MreC